MWGRVFATTARRQRTCGEREAEGKHRSTAPGQPEVEPTVDPYGPGGVPGPAGAQGVHNDPSDLELFREMWPEICAEETTYDAYAAAPYLMDFAARLDTADADDYLIVAGLIATYASEVPSDLEPAFKNAMQRGLELTLQRLQKCKTNEDLRYLLASVAP